MTWLKQLRWVILAWAIYAGLAMWFQHSDHDSACSAAFAAGMVAHFIWDGLLVLIAALTGFTVRGSCSHKHHGGH